jgi:hypothetical protein
VWQQVYRQLSGPGFELVAIAVDPSGPEAPGRFVAAAGVTFPALVDADGRSSDAFGFRVVPNGVLVDADGTIRYRKEGGFSNANADDLVAVRAFASGEDPGPSPAPRGVPYALGSLERELAATRMADGGLLWGSGRTEDAVREWQAALRIDPQNLTIRKAIWAARFPDRFHPAIDHAWQTEQLAREQAEEIAAGICGPDGCPIPRARQSEPVAMT